MQMSTQKPSEPPLAPPEPPSARRKKTPQNVSLRRPRSSGHREGTALQVRQSHISCALLFDSCKSFFFFFFFISLNPRGTS